MQKQRWRRIIKLVKPEAEYQHREFCHWEYIDATADEQMLSGNKVDRNSVEDQSGMAFEAMLDLSKFLKQAIPANRISQVEKLKWIYEMLDELGVWHLGDEI